MDAINRQIIAQLTEAAREYFATLDHQLGTYTAAELAANVRTGDKKKLPIYTEPTAEDKWSRETLSFSAGSFTCETPRALLFKMLWQMEQIERVSQRDKARFTHEKEGGTTFFVNIPKEAVELSKFVGSDACRPQMEQIYLDPERGALVATDTHILTEMPAMVEGAGDLPDEIPALFIDPKHIKNLTGRTRVQIVEEDGAKIAIYTNEAGEVYKNELNRGRFPDYRRVYPKVSAAGYLKVTPKGVKELIGSLKTAKKARVNHFTLSTVEDSNELLITIVDHSNGCSREIALPLASPAPLTLRVGIGVKECIEALGNWNGGIWFSDPSRPVIFDSESARIIIVMPFSINDAVGSIKDAECPALNRDEILPVKAEASETPQISTETAETINVSAEGEKSEIKHISAIMETCRLYEETGEETDEYKYYNWLRDAQTIGYRTIADKALTEALTNLILAAYRRGKGHVLAMNDRGELVDTVLVSADPEPIQKLEQLPQPAKIAPQSPQMPPAVNYVTPVHKRRQRIKIEPNRAFRNFRTNHTTISCIRTIWSANAPPYWPKPQSTTGSTDRLLELKKFFRNLANKIIMAIRIYARVSTLEQNYDQQMQDIKAYFAAHSLNMADVAEIVEEHESGGKSYTDRKFQQLLNKCKPGDYIYAASTDRLGRSFIDMMRLMEDAKKRGVIIVACKQNLSLDDDNSMAKIVLAVTAIMDEDERKRIKHRTANKKAWQREQIEKHGYFIVENGNNAGEKRAYVGNPKWNDMSDAQKSALTAAQEASQLARQNSVIEWRENSMAVKFALRKRAEGWGIMQIADELGKLYDDCPEIYGTPTGCKPSKGTVSKWLREANPLVLAV